MAVISRASPDPTVQLRRELRDLGFDASKSLGGLPEWAAEAIEHPSGALEVRGHLAQHLGLRIEASGRLAMRAQPAVRFKTAKNTPPGKVAAAQSIATAVCRMVAAVTTVPIGNRWLPGAADLRTSKLKDGAPWIGLRELLEVCWSAGIPVIYAPRMPTVGAKMDGLVTRVGDRPVIFISKSMDWPAWILFILAHEMGHIYRGHIGANTETIVDESIGEDSDSGDAQEQEANLYGLQALTGEEERNAFQFGNQRVGAAALAAIAMRFGRERKIDPGHLLLNAARHSKIAGKAAYAVGFAALKHVENQGDASAMCRSFARRHIDFDRLSDSSSAFLASLGAL